MRFGSDFGSLSQNRTKPNRTALIYVLLLCYVFLLTFILSLFSIIPFSKNSCERQRLLVENWYRHIQLINFHIDTKLDISSLLTRSLIFFSFIIYFFTIIVPFFSFNFFNKHMFANFLGCVTTSKEINLNNITSLNELALLTR